MALSDSGTAQAGAAGTITLRAGASAVNEFYDGMIVHIIGGTGVGQSRIVKSYVGSTKVATMVEAWATTPNNTSVYVVRPMGSVEVASLDTGAITAAAFAAGAIDANAFAQGAADKVWSSAARTLTAISTTLALSVWDVLTANIATANSIGKKIIDWLAGTDTSTPSVNLTKIDDQTTVGNNATLNLKMLNIINDAGSAIVANAIGAGIEAAISADSTVGAALKLTTSGSNSPIFAFGLNSPGAYVQGGSDNPGAIFNGQGSGEGIRVIGGNLANGMIVAKGAGGTYDLALATPSSNLPSTAPSVTDIDTQLSTTHGAGAWDAVGNVSVTIPVSISGQNANIFSDGSYVYFGQKIVDGSWRETISGATLIIQRLELGVWVTKKTLP
jgi:hypothetical protein